MRFKNQLRSLIRNSITGVNFKALVLCLSVLLLPYLNKEKITHFLSKCIPLAAYVKSSGTGYPDFSGYFNYFIVSFICVALVSLLLFYSNLKFSLSRKQGVFLAIVMGAFIFWFYWNQSFPPLVNGNFMMNKVQVIDAKRFIGWMPISRTSTAYPLFTIAAISFYDYQHLLTALLALGNYILIARCLMVLCKINVNLAFSIAFLALISGALTLFSYGSEDLLFNLFFILLFTYFSLKGEILYSNIALVAVYLCRPQSLPALFPLYIFTHYKVIFLEKEFKGLLGPLIFSFFFLAWNIFLYQHDVNWLFSKTGNFISSVEEIQPIQVQGFVISKMSGTFFYHSIWTYGLLSLLYPLIFSLSVLKKYPFEICFGLGYLINAIMLDYLSMLYYNIRYLTYFFPFLIFLTHGFLSRRYEGTAKLPRYHLIAGFALFTVFATFSNESPFRFFDKSNIHPRTEDHVKLWENREMLRREIDRRDVVSCQLGRKRCRYPQYILKRSYGSASGTNADYIIKSRREYEKSACFNKCVEIFAGNEIVIIDAKKSR